MSMKYVDEYRDADLAKRISAEIAKLSGDQPFKLMEVCGGHTHTIYKHGIEDVLPRNIDFKFMGRGVLSASCRWAVLMMPLPSPVWTGSSSQHSEI